MRIMHLMLACFYIDNYSYQENLLPKYHKKEGHDVEIVASLFTFDENGRGKWLPEATKYVNEHGIPVTRLNFKKTPFSKRTRRYEGLMAELERFEPEVLFIHGVQFSDADVVVSYLKKHRNVRVYADNHSDFSNSAKNWVSKHIQHRIMWRRCAQMLNPFVRKFYGVLPARVEFLVNEYKLPREKVELLIMGADDQPVKAAMNEDAVRTMRQKYDIGEKDVVIMTGGKIDHNKPETLLLMETVNAMARPNTKLLVFGSVVPALKEQFDAQLSDRVQYIGWKKSEDIYSEFAVADLIVFPGKHSVLWEQAVGMGKPCIFRKIDGYSHIDLGGNCLYFEESSRDAYQQVITKALNTLPELEKVAREKGLETFSYNKIAKKALEE